MILRVEREIALYFEEVCKSIVGELKILRFCEFTQITLSEILYTTTTCIKKIQDFEILDRIKESFVKGAIYGWQ